MPNKGKRNMSRKNRVSSISRKRSSPMQAFWRDIIRQFGAAPSRTNRGDQDSDKSAMFIWSIIGGQPPTIPRPLGPHTGAQASILQCIPSFTTNNGVTLASGVNRISSGAAVATGNVAFALNDLQAVADYKGVFDQYRFEWVHIRFRSDQPAISTSGGGGPANVTLYVVVDRDDGNAPASLAAIQQYDNLRSCGATQCIDVILRPSLAVATQTSGAVAPTRIENPSWIDTANPDVPHFGVKFVITADGGVTTHSNWVVEAWYVLSFKNAH